MTATFRIGRVAGVDVGVNWSVLVVFGLIAWLLAAGRFPSGYPGQPAWAYVVAGLAAAVVFLAGLLAHEVSHAVVARHHGIQVEGITLWMFGGVARLKGEPRSPGADLRIAGVGPLVSIALGLVFGAVAAVMAVAGQTGLVFGTFVWLAGINIFLALFNALPAAPLDGGRILRAALWAWRGDRKWAAVMAARAGRVLGGALILFGLWQFLAAPGLGGLWLALIGWFLFGAAGLEEQQAQVGAALAGVHVRDIMSADPETAPSDITVAELVDRHLMPSKHSAFPIVAEGRLSGLVTLNRIRRVPREHWADTKVRDVACTADELTIASPDEPVTDLLPRLNECADGRALVVRDGNLIGIVSPTDISRALQRSALQS
ncbi:site-2 protease family protein [Allorhizocola rhizosphaerae]|uniref:site-2 protease family protein n=1 Tax=Allorhizocola rhizosphaerae TaxID=1872709 RepID=UPI000E3C9511|nr:site-2 protease family protein [Allorhizocola rhizosphaerae]